MGKVEPNWFNLDRLGFGAQKSSKSLKSKISKIVRLDKRRKYDKLTSVAAEQKSLE